MQIKMNMVVRIKAHEYRPGRWNDLGEMDEYVNELVKIDSPSLIFVQPLSFVPKTQRRWSFEYSDYCKANTIQPNKDEIDWPINY